MPRCGSRPETIVTALAGLPQLPLVKAHVLILGHLLKAQFFYKPHGRRVFAGESDLRRPCDGGIARKDCRDRGERLQRAEFVLTLQRQ